MEVGVWAAPPGDAELVDVVMTIGQRSISTGGVSAQDVGEPEETMGTSDVSQRSPMGTLSDGHSAVPARIPPDIKQ
jgi:hypothetical protein